MINMRTISEITKEITDIEKQLRKLYDQKDKLDSETDGIIAKEVLDSKIFNKCKWSVNDISFLHDGFNLRPDDKSIFDDLISKMKLYPHGYFNINEHVEMNESDGDFYLRIEGIENGIEFIKINDLKIDDENMTYRISELKEELIKRREFIDKIHYGDKNYNSLETYLKHKERSIKALKDMKMFLHLVDYSEDEERVYSSALDIAIQELEISMENQ